MTKVDPTFRLKYNLYLSRMEFIDSAKHNAVDSLITDLCEAELNPDEIEVEVAEFQPSKAYIGDTKTKLVFSITGTFRNLLLFVDSVTQDYEEFHAVITNHLKPI